MPLEPPPTPWQLSLAGARPGEDLVAVGADLEPGTVLAAYRRGLFPMGLGAHGTGPLGWWSPDPRGVLLPGDLHVSRSLRRSLRHLEIRVDTAFEQVVQGCADPARDGRWITPAFTAAYTRLHRLGWAHSVEAWHDDRLAGGLYGLSLGGLFAAESMFHRVRDASKAAVCGLLAIMGDCDPDRWLVDVQWRTDHLATLGVREAPRTAYLRLLESALSAPPPAGFGGPAAPSAQAP